MITYDFLKMVVDEVFKTDVETTAQKVNYYLGADTDSNITDLGYINIDWIRTDDSDAGTITLDTAVDNKSYYFDYTTNGENYSVGYINTESYNSYVSSSKTKTGTYNAYAIPLAKTVTLPDGYTIKVNPYVENESGEHIRGIRLKFSIA